MIEPGATLEGGVAPTTNRGRLAPSVVGLALGAVIGWSAFLLFLVEPMIGRLVLPVFGGTPAVWATTLCFFQVVLLLGYLYGHVTITRLARRPSALLHVALVVAAALSLAIAPARVADLRLAGWPDTLNLLAILVALIGLPAFVLTTTTPVVSAWAAARSSRGDSYWLYALSNAGSLAALLAYPFVVEPRLGLTAQRAGWTVAFVAFGAAIAATALWASRRSRRAADERVRAVELEADVEPVDTRRRVRWLLLAAVPSGLLNAVTTYVATDLVSAPLLWLVPLAIYLATFIVAFSGRGRRAVPLAIGLAPAAATLMWVPYGSAGGWGIVPLVALMYGGLAVVSVALHGRLALDRPDARRLTEFYLLISVGGAAAAIFVAIIAPLVFPGVWELPILLVLALVGLAVSQPRGQRPATRGPATRPRPPVDLSPFLLGMPLRLGPYLVVAALLVGLLLREQSLGAEAGLRWLLVGGVVLAVGARPAFLAVSTAFVLALAVLVLQPAAVFRDRSFFGVTEVLRPDGAPFTTLMNGTTVHGIQSTDPELARAPEAYYARPGPFGDLFRILAADGAAHEVGAVGLGAGAIATYVRPGWGMTFYEIDPLVAEVASDPRFFTYLTGAAERPRIVLGDARLSLRDVPDGRYDALIVDAFSSDAIPAHLLTVEAMAEYRRVVRPEGLILIHVSNRYYDLVPAVAGAAEANGLPAFHRLYLPAPADGASGAAITDALVLTRSPSAADALSTAGWTAVSATTPPVTDDFLDLLRYLRPLA